MCTTYIICHNLAQDRIRSSAFVENRFRLAIPVCTVCAWCYVDHTLPDWMAFIQKAPWIKSLVVSFAKWFLCVMVKVLSTIWKIKPTCAHLLGFHQVDIGKVLHQMRAHRPINNQALHLPLSWHAPVKDHTFSPQDCNSIKLNGTLPTKIQQCHYVEIWPCFHFAARLIRAQGDLCPLLQPDYQMINKAWYSPEPQYRLCRGFDFDIFRT